MALLKTVPPEVRALFLIYSRITQMVHIIYYTKKYWYQHFAGVRKVARLAEGRAAATASTKGWMERKTAG